MKHVVKEEGHSCYVIVFGLLESDNAILTEKIGEPFKKLDEKPKLEATRLGKFGLTWLRPVKVSLYLDYLPRNLTSCFCSQGTGIRPVSR